jgi:membrane associated rhomboid family serine protease
MLYQSDVQPGIKNLIICNCVMVLVCVIFQQAQQVDLFDTLALHSPDSPLFRPWQFLTSTFLHGNASSPYINVQHTLMHLLFNMLGLFFFGRILERMWGTAFFLAFYLAAGIIASACHAAALHYEHSILLQGVAEFSQNSTWAQFNELLNKHPQLRLNTSATSEFFSDLRTAWSEQPLDPEYAQSAKTSLHTFLYGSSEGYAGYLNGKTVGASGAVMGVLAAFAYLFPNTTLFVGFIFPMKAKYFIALYAAGELFYSWRNIAGDNVAHIAHLGGMAAGFIIVILWNKFNKKTFY